MINAAAVIAGPTGTVKRAGMLTFSSQVALPHALPERVVADAEVHQQQRGLFVRSHSDAACWLVVFSSAKRLAFSRLVVLLYVVIVLYPAKTQDCCNTLTMIRRRTSIDFDLGR
jgi:hypothetical protein